MQRRQVRSLPSAGCTAKKVNTHVNTCTSFECAESGRAAIHRNANGLAKTLGTSAPALLAVVQQPPEGSLSLVLHMLHVLTEAANPSQPLVAACLQLHSVTADAQVLVPALRGMEKATVLRLLP